MDPWFSQAVAAGSCSELGTVQRRQCRILGTSALSDIDRETVFQLPLRFLSHTVPYNAIPRMKRGQSFQHGGP